MNLDEYQAEAQKTNKYSSGRDPHGVLGPILGLASESGALINAYKKYFRGRVDYAQNKDFIDSGTLLSSPNHRD